MRRSGSTKLVFCLLVGAGVMGLNPADADARGGKVIRSGSSHGGGGVLVPKAASEIAQPKPQSPPQTQNDHQAAQAAAFERARRTLEAERPAVSQTMNTPAQSAGALSCVAGCYR